MRVFVTGHRGYIGAHLVDLLKQDGHTVTGCDIGLFDSCAWEQLVPADRELRKDVRLVTLDDLAGHDCVMHLAALSNDPMGELDAAATFAINRDASIQVAQFAKKAGVPRYLFAASCSVYGAGQKLDLDEGDPLNPLTAYAKSKIDTERAVSKLADDTFSPAFLRNATAYGHSPMLRVDLVVNSLLACAVATGEIRIMSDGSPWRPLIHCSRYRTGLCRVHECAQRTHPQQGSEYWRQFGKLSGPRRRRPGQEIDSKRQDQIYGRDRG